MRTLRDMVRFGSLVCVALVGACGLGVSMGATELQAKEVRVVSLRLQGDAAASPSDKVEAKACSHCADHCITYRHHNTLRKTCCGCEESVKTTLKVTDPCCCCCVEIPICLPACCKGEPKVCCQKGLMGRNVVTYEWCCGYKVRVVFERCGDITVHSYGR